MPPVIDNFAPASGTAIAPSDPIVFDVTDDAQTLVEISVHAGFPDGSCECVFFNSAFVARYSAGSSRVSITDGYRFTVRRTGGWIGTPVTLDIIAINDIGELEAADF